MVWYGMLCYGRFLATYGMVWYGIVGSFLSVRSAAIPIMFLLHHDVFLAECRAPIGLMVGAASYIMVGMLSSGVVGSCCVWYAMICYGKIGFSLSVRTAAIVLMAGAVARCS